MSRWTKNQKEMQGYRRKLAYGHQKVSLATAPWDEKNKEVGQVIQRKRGKERTKKTALELAPINIIHKDMELSWNFLLY